MYSAFLLKLIISCTFKQFFLFSTVQLRLFASEDRFNNQRAMPSTPRLPASWVGFHADALRGSGRAGTGLRRE
jgi:hypothetical protein